MSLTNVNYTISPRIVPADTETVVEIAARHPEKAFQDGVEYEIGYYPTEEFSVNSGWTIDTPPRIVKAANGALQFSVYFEGEQEHVLTVRPAGSSDPKMLDEFRIYSLESDLFERRPYKGDFHMHSFRSDGREAPAYVAGSCRQIGLDFMAVTDHRLYGPSIEAQEAYADLAIDLQIFNGEEVHPPESHVHIINYGGRFSINELFAEKEAYYASVKALQETIGPLPAGVDPYLYASTVWCFNKIREAGGMAIFCHPYWFTQRRYSPAGKLTAHLFDTQPFDAYEVIGGYYKNEADSNTLQVAYYHDQRAMGRSIPIVGASDAHGCERGELHGWYYSIVFAQSLALSDIIDGVKDCQSVAVEAMAGEVPRAYGPFRLVKYALFLMREIFPRHDALCAEEGRLMLAHREGDTTAAATLASFKGRVQKLMESYWAK